jgi:hypothetical protein
MMGDPIEQLLGEADARTPVAPVDPGIISQRVIQQVHRRRVARSIGAIAAILIVGVLVTARWPREPQPVVTIARLDDLTSIRQQIDFQQRLVDALLASERQRRAEVRLAGIVVPSDDQPVERAAARVIVQAGRLLSSSDHDAVIQAYDQVIDSFPNTAAADLARRRLAELRKEG